MAPEQSNLKAAAWMAASITSFIVMSVAGRATTAELNVFQVMELRSVIGLLFLLPLVHINGGFPAMRTLKLKQHIGRNIVHYSGQAAWLYALMLIPLAELIAIEFTTPLWTAILAVTFLGEGLTRQRITAIALGLAGVAIVIRPGAERIDPGHLFVLGAAMAFAVSLVMVRSLTRSESVVRIVFWMLIIQSVIGLLPAIHVWQTPSPGLWPWILLIALTGMSSHLFLARALAYADATIVSPMDFLRLPLTALVGWLLYNERIDMFTVVGAVLIIAGNLVNLRKPGRVAEAANVETP